MVPLRARDGAAGRAGWCRCARGMVPLGAEMQIGPVVRIARKRSWLIRASWWFWCTIDPLIDHEARINHAKVKVIALVCELVVLMMQMSV